MIEALVLYGSKARGDEQVSSDTDLMGISRINPQHEKHEHDTTNLHIYPLDWLLGESSRGGLFLMHIAFEAVAIYDPLDLLGDISRAFRFKPSYAEEVETGMRILRAVSSLEFAEFDGLVRRRYYWALRTVVIAIAAENREVRFGASDLQEFSTVEGLAAHINNRASTSPIECKSFAIQVIKVVDQKYNTNTQPRKSASVADMVDLTRLRKRVGLEQDYLS